MPPAGVWQAGCTGHLVTTLQLPSTAASRKQSVPESVPATAGRPNSLRGSPSTRLPSIHSSTHFPPTLNPTPPLRRYVVLNRPYAFVQWVQKAKIPEKYVLMSEPDHIFLRPLPNFMRGDKPGGGMAAGQGCHRPSWCLTVLSCVWGCPARLPGGCGVLTALPCIRMNSWHIVLAAGAQCTLCYTNANPLPRPLSQPPSPSSTSSPTQRRTPISRRSSRAPSPAASWRRSRPSATAPPSCASTTWRW